jgi:predicted GIY-YIG superfamily endonuclease
MHWIYILKCKDNYYYVGETCRLYRRFYEHYKGLGGLNTSIYPPENIVAIYKVDTINKFIDYNYNITNNKHRYSLLLSF